MFGHAEMQVGVQNGQIASKMAKLDVKLRRKVGAEVWYNLVKVERYIKPKHGFFVDIQNVMSN